MKTRKLMTIRPHKYGTRHLTAGEEYEAPIKHAFALVAGKKARFSDRPASETTERKAEATVEETTIAEAAPTAIETAETKSIDRLRAEAEQLGVAVDGRWGVARLQHEIMQARRWR
jgi:hypothetical protein